MTIIFYLLWNVIVFMIYGTDKFLAKKSMRRISEKSLIICAFFMGGIGALLGMFFFRHKTKKIKFNVLIPLSVVFNLIICIFLYMY